MANVFAFQSTTRVAGRPETLSDIVDELNYNLNSESDRVRLGVILSAVGRRSYGPLLLIVGLFAISPATIAPGMTSIAATIILLVAAQMAVGSPRPWVPRFELNWKMSRPLVFKFLEKVRPRVRAMERSGWLQTRLAFLSEPPFVNVVALIVIAAALVTYPLSLIPVAPLAPGLAIVFFGLGMTARDGLWLLVGAAFFIAAFLLASPLIF